MILENQESSSLRPSRGAFVLLEGVDRCGKTTQCKLLLNRLLAAGLAATAMRFPDRTTATGQVINSYLTSSANQLDDHAIHLLFSANRWEAATSLAKHLQKGTHVICDRYAYSGVAFSSAKINEETGEQLLSVDWCRSPDKGLPAPDSVIFLDVTADIAESRGGYGDERYEKRDMQLRVRERFGELQNLDRSEGNGVCWHVVDASRSIEEVHEEIWRIFQLTCDRLEKKAQSIRRLWTQGTFEVPDKEN